MEHQHVHFFLARIQDKSYMVMSVCGQCKLSKAQKLLKRARGVGQAGKSKPSTVAAKSRSRPATITPAAAKEGVGKQGSELRRSSRRSAQVASQAITLSLEVSRG